MVTALDKNWHPECFCCVKCSRAFGEEGNGRHILSGLNTQLFTVNLSRVMFVGLKALYNLNITN